MKEGRASVLRKRLPASFALQKLRALLAVTPVAYDIPFPPLSIVGALFIRTAKPARIHHGRHPPQRVVYYDTTDSIIMLEGHHPLFRGKIMELSSGFADAQPDSAPLRPTAARRSLRLLSPWGVQLISRPLGRSQY